MEPSIKRLEEHNNKENVGKINIERWFGDGGRRWFGNKLRFINVQAVLYLL